MNRNKGFSLIEILVVIGIMGTLVTILLPNFIGARQRGQDSRRKLDIGNFAAALENYRSVNGTYPAAKTDLVPTYITTLPTDPVSGYTYEYTSLPTLCTNSGDPSYCTDYTLGALLNATSTCSTYPATTCGPSSAACNYCIGPLGQK